MRCGRPPDASSKHFDVIFGLASPWIDILVKDTGVAELQVRDDEARVWPFRADFDARDDPLDAAPARSSVEELLEAAELAILGRSLKARLGAGLKALNMPAQCRGRRDAQDVIEAVGPAPVKNFGTAIMAIAAQQDFGVWPVGADRSQQAPQESANLLAAGPLGGAKHGGDEATLAIEHDDRLKAVFIVMRIKTAATAGRHEPHRTCRRCRA